MQVDAVASADTFDRSQVDVVTAVHAPHAGLVSAAWRSLQAQTSADWRWYVQVDGPAGAVLDALEACGALADPRVLVDDNGAHVGPAVTRNVALGRSGAALVQNLDADDELEPNALATLGGALREHREAGFAFGHARDLLPDGSLQDHPLPLRPGLVPRGRLVDLWSTSAEDVRQRLPAHPAGVMWRRSLLLAVGGWPALHGMEDTGLLIAASAMTTAVLVDHPILRYRKHPDQVTTTNPAYRGGRRRSPSSTSAPPTSASPPTSRPPVDGDGDVSREHDDRVATDVGQLAPPHLAPPGMSAHEAPAASRNDARSPHSSGSSRGRSS